MRYARERYVLKYLTESAEEGLLPRTSKIAVRREVCHIPPEPSLANAAFQLLCHIEVACYAVRTSYGSAAVPRTVFYIFSGADQEAS